MKTRRHATHFTRLLGLLLTVTITASCSSNSSGSTISYMVEVPDGVAVEASGGDWEHAGKSRNVQCTLQDVDTSGLGTNYSTEVPRGTWPNPRPEGGQRCGDDFETLMFRLANCERVKRRLAPLECDLRLVWVARAHSSDMLRRGYFDHLSPEGANPFDRMQARGLTFHRAAENVAITPNMAFAHRGWMDSKGHRGNIVNPDFTHGGLGIVRSENGFYLTALFMTP